MTKLEANITMIPLKNLSVIWVKAQRAYNEKWAKQIGEDFDPDKFDPICVTKPNGVGMYHIVDGQHRKGAAEIFAKGDQNQQIPCRVIADADPARAAEIWLGLNQGRKAIKPVSSFLVAVEAQRETEVAVYNIVKRAGFRISEVKRENTLSAVSALKKIYVNCGGEVLAKTLTTCRHLWGSDPQGVQGVILSGLGIFLNEFHNYVDLVHLKKCITSKYKSPGNFVEAARFGASKSSETLEVAMMEVILATYNHKRLQDKKLRRKEK